MAYDERDLDQLNSEFLKKLLLFAKKTIARYPYITDRDADDFVQEAIVKFLGGERQWDPRRVDLFRLLCWAMHGLITNYARGAHVRRMIDLTESSTEPSDETNVPPDDLVWIGQLMRLIEGCKKPGCDLRRIYDIFREKGRISAMIVSKHLGISYKRARGEVAKFNDLLGGRLIVGGGDSGCPLGPACFACPKRKHS